MKKTINIRKVFNNKKGVWDYRVWTRVTDFVCGLISEKRINTFRPIHLKRDIKVTVIIEEGKKK